MKRHCKIIISVITMALIFSFVFSPASFAMSPRQFGSWVLSALTALNIVSTSASMTTADLARDFVDYLDKPWKIVANQFVDVPYTTSIDAIDDYLDNQVLKVDKDVVEIDGVPYSNVWLSHDAAEKFRVNAWDLKTAFNIASESNGTYASGVGFIHGIPVYDLGNRIYESQRYVTPGNGSFDIGDTTFGVSGYVPGESGHTVNFSWTNTDGTYSRSALAIYAENARNNVRFYRDTATGSQNVLEYQQYNTNGFNTITPLYDGTSFDREPFDFDWVAGDIPADEVLPADYGINIQVPTSVINNWYVTYPDTPDSTTLELDLPELETKIDDLIDLIIPVLPILDIDYAPHSDSPVPEPGTIANTQWSLLDEILNWILNTLDAIHGSIITIGTTISTGISDILDDLGDIGDGITNIPDALERHVIDTVRRGLDVLKSVFAPIMLLLRNALGIWHYVVEWVSSISAPFTWYLGIVNNGAPIILKPILACIAGFICIGVYKRIGR